MVRFSKSRDHGLKRLVSGDGRSSPWCMSIMALILVRVCDGGYVENVMKDDERSGGRRTGESNSRNWLAGRFGRRGRRGACRSWCNGDVSPSGVRFGLQDASAGHSATTTGRQEQLPRSTEPSRSSRSQIGGVSQSLKVLACPCVIRRGGKARASPGSAETAIGKPLP